MDFCTDESPFEASRVQRHGGVDLHVVVPRRVAGAAVVRGDQNHAVAVGVPDGDTPKPVARLPGTRGLTRPGVGISLQGLPGEGDTDLMAIETGRTRCPRCMAWTD